MVLTETCLKESGDESKIADLTPPGYKLFSFPRQLTASIKGGGGIAVIMKDCLASHTSINTTLSFTHTSFENTGNITSSRNSPQLAIAQYGATPPATKLVPEGPVQKKKKHSLKQRLAAEKGCPLNEHNYPTISGCGNFLAALDLLAWLAESTKRPCPYSHDQPEDGKGWRSMSISTLSPTRHTYTHHGSGSSSSSTVRQKAHQQQEADKCRAVTTPLQLSTVSGGARQWRHSGRAT
ncbi:hypothetical protein ACOMHN_019601 [Nucella lapillus]